MRNFIYKIDTKLYFGGNRLEELIDVLPNASKKILLVYGGKSIKKNGLYQKITTILKDYKIVEFSGIVHNPRIEHIRKGITLAKKEKIDFVLAVGGGSVIDSAKMIALGVNITDDIWEVMTILPRNNDHKAMPLGVIVTTAATGSEMNGFAVISNEEHKEKISFAHDSLKPLFTFSDPTTLYSLPRTQIVYGIIDSIAHICEQYFSSHEDERIVDRQAEGLMQEIIKAGVQVLAERENYKANATLMWGATQALNNSLILGRLSGGDWLTHEIEHKISGVTDMAHAKGIAIILPVVLTYYLEQDLAQNLPLTKFVNLGKNVFGLTNDSDSALAKQTVQEIKKLIESMQENFRFHEKAQIVTVEIAKQVTKSGRFGTYHSLDYADIVQILEMCQIEE